MQGTKFNLVTDLQIMLFNVTHSNFYFECNTERGSTDQLYIELGKSHNLALKLGFREKSKFAETALIVSTFLLPLAIISMSESIPSSPTHSEGVFADILPGPFGIFNKIDILFVLSLTILP